MLFNQGQTAQEQVFLAAFIFLVGFSVFILLLAWLNMGWVFWALVLWMIYKKIVRSFKERAYSKEVAKMPVTGQWYRACASAQWRNCVRAFYSRDVEDIRAETGNYYDDEEEDDIDLEYENSLDYSRDFPEWLNSVPDSLDGYEKEYFDLGSIGAGAQCLGDRYSGLHPDGLHDIPDWDKAYQNYLCAYEDKESDKENYEALQKYLREFRPSQYDENDEYEYDYENGEYDSKGCIAYRLGLVCFELGKREDSQRLNRYTEGTRFIQEALEGDVDDLDSILLLAKFLAAGEILAVAEKTQSREIKQIEEGLSDSSSNTRDVDNKHQETRLQWLWLEGIASEGYVDAQFNLGLAYAQGIHVERDLDKAIGWFSKAAEQGDEESKDNLDCLNEKQPIQFTAIRTHDVDELNPPEPKRVFCEGYMYS